MAFEELKVVGFICVCSASAFAGSQTAKQLNKELDKVEINNLKSY